MSQPLEDTKIFINKAKKAFYDAKQRCVNISHPRYNDWGGRGITFQFSSFDEFLSCIGIPKEGDTLDRIDNDGDYCVGNVRWVTRTVQQHNKRKSKHNKTGHTGVRKVVAKGLVGECWQAFITINGVFHQLYAGPSFEEAVIARKSFTHEDLK